MSKLVLLLAFICASFVCITFAQEIITQEEMNAHGLLAHTHMAIRKQQYLDEKEENGEYSLQSIGNGAAVVDYSQYFSTSIMSCLKNQGFIAAIPRGYQSVGRVDPNMVQNVANARSAGFQYVDVYAFPCPTCGNAAGQFQTLWNAFTASHVNVGMVWLDIEGTQYWTSSAATNQSFTKEYLAAAAKVSAKIGIYSSRYQWNAIYGTNFSLNNAYPIWYAHYDNNPSCSDWAAFGGFNKPTLKQYVGDTTVCGGGIDISSYC